MLEPWLSVSSSMMRGGLRCDCSVSVSIVKDTGSSRTTRWDKLMESMGLRSAAWAEPYILSRSQIR